MSRYGTNNGHGHAWARPDGVKARCGGAGLCQACAADKEYAEQFLAGQNALKGEAPPPPVASTADPVREGRIGEIKTLRLCIFGESDAYDHMSEDPARRNDLMLAKMFELIEEL